MYFSVSSKGGTNCLIYIFFQFHIYRHSLFFLLKSLNLASFRGWRWSFAIKINWFVFICNFKNVLAVLYSKISVGCTRKNLQEIDSLKQIEKCGPIDLRSNFISSKHFIKSILVTSLEFKTFEGITYNFDEVDFSQSDIRYSGIRI